MSRDQRGFTLIEMSIVLVIIGLIVGGILKGQEVIESARQKNMATLYDQLRSAQNTFVDRYRALPGDYNEASTKIHASMVNGNQNGYLGTGTGFTSVAGIAGADGSVGEYQAYFNMLIAAGLFGGGQITAGTSAITGFSGGAVESPFPAGPWSNSGLSAIQGTHEGLTAAPAPVTTIWLRLANTSATINAAAAPLTAASAFQIDSKFDDGLPGTGRIRNTNLTTTPCGGIAAEYSVAGATSGARQCDLLFSTE